MTALIPTEKTCRHCWQTKPAGDFGRKPTMRDGLQSWCKDCTNDRGREIRRGRGERPAHRRVRVRPGWIRCSDCGKDLPESEFRKDGHGRPYSWCKPCHNAYLAELNRFKRKDPAYRAKLRIGERKRRTAEKREVRAERVHRLHASQMAIARLKAAGWTMRRIAVESGLARSTLQHIQNGKVPFPETYERLMRFARSHG